MERERRFPFLSPADVRFIENRLSPKGSQVEAERRSFTIDRVSVRARPESGLGFKGHAAVFEERAYIGTKPWGWYEQISRGAFTRAIAEDDVRFLVDHDPSRLLARNVSGTLRLAEDKVGLAVDADMADTSYARDVAHLLERGDLSQMSFAFIPKRVTEEDLGDGEWLRRIEEVELWDVSVVAYPAYEGTDAARRSLEVRRAEHRTNQLQELRRQLDAAYGREYPR